MAFANKIGGLFKQVVKANPSVYQAICCMSSSKVFIGGLSYATDEPSLREAFSSFGEVVESRVIMDRETGRSRGFGFVTFTSEEEASAAMSGMNGKELHGRIVKVNHANERTVGGFRGGYGGGGAYGGGGYGSGGYGGGGAGYGDNSNSYGGAGGNYGGDSYNAGGGGNYGGGSYNAEDGGGTGSGSNYGGDNYSSGTGNYGGNNFSVGGSAGGSSMGYGSGGDQYNDNVGGSSGGDFSNDSGNGFINDKVDRTFH